MDMIIGLVLYYQHYMLGARIKAKNAQIGRKKCVYSLHQKNVGVLRI